MKIIKNQQITEDFWTHIANGDELTAGNISVSLERWEQEKAQLSHHAGNIGIRLGPADQIESIAADLNKINLLVLEFPIFTDGRLFSQARLLRSRYHYKNEIRAIGNYLPDQVFYLSQVGVNSFEFESMDQLYTALSTMNDFSVKYQASTH